MLKEVMDSLGLDITRKYKDLYSFDSRRVKYLGLIKDLVISLHQIPEDVLAKFGVLLSISWSAKLKGTMQMDFSYELYLFLGFKEGYIEKTNSST